MHGGGFYNMQKYAVQPKRLPEHLHWSFWESYSTWLTGFALFTVSYLWNASTYLIDRSKMDWQPGTAVAVALAFFVVFWLVYDGICRLFGRGRHGDVVVGALVAVFIAAASWLACHWFAGRAAFLLVGAMMATTMSANVFFWIIPGQRKNVAAMKAGLPVDPVHGQRGKQRSVHNTYFTLPVVFAMMSNHYSVTYTHPQNWLVLLLIMLGGAAVRQFFVVRHRFKLGNARNPLGYALLGVAVLGLTLMWMRPEPRPEIRADRSAPALRPPRRWPPRWCRRRRRPGPRRGFRAGAEGGGTALPAVPRRAGANEERAPGLAPGNRQPRAGHLPAGGGVARDADEQFHRHDRRRTRADRHLVQGGRAHALGPPAGAACCRPVPPLPFHPSSLAFMPIYDATLPYPATWPATAAIRRTRAGRARAHRRAVRAELRGRRRELGAARRPRLRAVPVRDVQSGQLPGPPPSMESIYEYGSRAGVWRILREFEKRRLPLTVFGVGMALQRHPELASACVELGHEIACHGWRWVHYQDVDEATEREHMFLGMQAIEQLTGARPLGWYTGRDSPARAGWWPTMAASNTTATTTATTCRSGCRCAEATARSCRS